MSAAADVRPDKASAIGSVTDPYRVMVVEDSAVIRGFLTRILEEDGDIAVVASVANGKIAVNTALRHDVEVIVLDIEMPVMDGMTALELLLKQDPKVQVIMASTLTLKNAEVSLRALSLGAADYIPKPTSAREVGGSRDFRHMLIEKVRNLGARRRGASVVTSNIDRTIPGMVAKAREGHRGVLPILRKPSLHLPKVIAIGSSTGGPQALLALLKQVGEGFPLPILITQHMPPTFTTILAEHISRVCQIPCAEAMDGEPIKAGSARLAPGDFHMVVEKGESTNTLRLLQTPPENFCRPAVDPMLRSVAEAYGAHALAVILTGMGQDGLKGSDEIVVAGGTVIAQDEESSVVWGMPGAVAMAGLCSAILPLQKIPAYVHERISGKAP